MGKDKINSNQQGWECPKCGSVMAPWMPNCTKCGGVKSVLYEPQYEKLNSKNGKR